MLGRDAAATGSECQDAQKVTHTYTHAHMHTHAHARTHLSPTLERILHNCRKGAITSEALDSRKCVCVCACVRVRVRVRCIKETKNKGEIQKGLDDTRVRQWEGGGFFFFLRV